MAQERIIAIKVNDSNMNNFGIETSTTDVVKTIQTFDADPLEKLQMGKTIQKVGEKAAQRLKPSDEEAATLYEKNKEIVKAHQLLVKKSMAFRHLYKRAWDYSAQFKTNVTYREAVLAREEAWQRAKRLTRDIAAMQEEFRESGEAVLLSERHEWQCMGSILDMKANAGKVVYDPSVTFDNNLNVE